jgi:uncharacterized protein (TIRG00374 family)
VRVAIAAAIIVYVFRTKIDVGGFVDRLRAINGAWAALAFAMFGLCLGLGLVRWSILLRVQGICIRAVRLVSIYFIGHFFNAFMLGATGGDLIKAYYIARETHRKKAEVVMTVFIDRLIGLYGLFMIAAVMMVWQFGYYRRHPVTWGPALFVGALLLAGTIVPLVALQKQWFTRIPFFRRLFERLPGHQVIQRLYEAFSVYRHHPRPVMISLAMSVVIHSSLIFAVVFLSYGLGEPLSILLAYTLAPLAFCIAAIPITPGGWGLREMLFAELLGPAGISPETAVAVSAVYGGMMLVWSLFGGIPYLLYKAEIPPDAFEERPAPAA